MERGEKPVVAFVVPGKPVTKARPRLGAGGKIYTPYKTKEFERKVRAGAIDAKRTVGLSDDAALVGPVEVRMVFRWDGAEPFTHVTVIPLDADVNVQRTDRPDLDNLVKSVLDGLQSAQRGVEAHVPILLKDDRQVVRLVAEFDMG